MARSSSTLALAIGFLGVGIAAAGDDRQVKADPPARALPVLKALWSFPSYSEKQTEQFVGQAIQANEAHTRPTIPAFVPIAVTTSQNGRPTTLVIHRSFAGIHCRRLQGGKLAWDSLSDWGCDGMVRSARALFQFRDWVRYYQQKSHLTLLFENSLMGRLSTDGRMLYAIEDLGLPPPPEAVKRAGIFEKAILGNHLQAYSLPDFGKLVWDLGGLSSTNPDLKATYFLGPPLAVLGNLYVLNEKNSELRLFCLEPPQPRPQPVKILWALMLGTARTGLLHDPGRRVRAALLAYADGILVCPTNAGWIVGVDPRTGRQVWKHTYQAQDKPKGAASLTGTWKVAPPVIHDGKVVFTDPATESIYCLNLHDGKRLWQADRKGDLYLAGVHRDRVVLVGPSTCRALRLTDGHPLWQIETGLPSGYGTIRGNILYLPLKTAAATHGPEVCALDLDAGRILAHSRPRKRADGSLPLPGNLLDADGIVISQTVTAITAYPQQGVIQARIDALLKKNPNDPAAFMERGDLHSLMGDPAAAVEDFRTALAKQPPPEMVRRVKLRLFDALTELGQRDPKALEKYLDEYEKLGKEVLKQPPP